MKNLIIAFILLAFSLESKAQQQELQQLALNTAKLAQFKQILRDMKSGYQLLTDGYGKIKDISEGNFKLHKAFLDGLYAVSPEVKRYARVPEIVSLQGVLVKEYKSSSAVFRQVAYFAPAELEYIDRVYNRLLKQSLRNLDELATVLTSGTLRMSDDERIQAIDRIYMDMQQKVSFLRSFNNETKVLGINRSREKQDVRMLQKLYGLKF